MSNDQRLGDFFLRYQKFHQDVWPICPDGKPDPSKKPNVSIALYAEASKLYKEVTGIYAADKNYDNMPDEAHEAWYVLNKYLAFVKERINNDANTVPEPVAPTGFLVGSEIGEIVTVSYF